MRKTAISFPQSGELIRYYRELRGYKVNEFASMIPIDPKYLSNLEAGHQMASIRVLFRMSTILNVPIEKLLLINSEELLDESPKQQIIIDLDSMNTEEIQLVSEYIKHIIPLTRRYRGQYLILPDAE